MYNSVVLVLLILIGMLVENLELLHAFFSHLCVSFLIPCLLLLRSDLFVTFDLSIDRSMAGRHFYFPLTRCSDLPWRPVSVSTLSAPHSFAWHGSNSVRINQGQDAEGRSIIAIDSSTYTAASIRKDLPCLLVLHLGLPTRCLVPARPCTFP